MSTQAGHDQHAGTYAAIYVRVSTEDQGKGFSLPTQIDACQKLAEREGYTVPESHLLVDERVSGTTLDRPGLRKLRKLRELIQTQAIAAVIVIDPDRLSRNLGHQLLLAEELERARVKLLIVSHPLEQGPEGWMFFQMRGALAEYERAKLLERTQRGTLGRARAGNPWGGQVPLGYRAVREPHKARWEIEEEEAALVRRIFAMCLSGMTTYGISEQLTRERVPTCRERSAQGRFRCGRCGRTMCGTAPRGTRRYNCSSMNFIRDPEARCRGSVKADEVEQQVWAAVLRVLEDPALIAQEAIRQHVTAEQDRTEVAREVALVAASLAKCDREDTRWNQAYAADVIGLEELKGYKAEIGSRRASLTAHQEALYQRLEAIGHGVEQVEALMGYCARVRESLRTFDPQEQRRTLEALDIRVTWTPGVPLAIRGTIVPMPASRYTE